MLVLPREEEHKVAAAGIWWGNRGKTAKHTSTLNGLGSELTTVILVALYVRFKDFLKKKKNASKLLRELWPALHPPHSVVSGRSLPLSRPQVPYSQDITSRRLAMPGQHLSLPFFQLQQKGPGRE